MKNNPGSSMSAPSVRFQTKLTYDSRESKARYVWDKYSSILKEARVLDVGADECHLKQLLPDPSRYWGVGLGGSPDQQLNLEQGGLPFTDRSYDVALCLDVLEHIENPQQIADELCRVSARHVVIALPNALGTVWAAMRFAPYQPDRLMKFYGFPPAHPGDRHKWFTWPDEIDAFCADVAKRNGFRVVQTDYTDIIPVPGGLKGWLYERAMRFLFRPGFDRRNLYNGTSWTVLERIAP